MKVAVLPLRRATFLTTCLYHMVRSAMTVSLSKSMDSSACPAVATSWWKTSMGIPTPCSVSAISARISYCVSFGDTGK